MQAPREATNWQRLARALRVGVASACALHIEAVAAEDPLLQAVQPGSVGSAKRILSVLEESTAEDEILSGESRGLEDTA